MCYTLLCNAIELFKNEKKTQETFINAEKKEK